MSKIKGNVLNPIDTLEKYGTDALRFALSTGTSPGNDIKLTPSRLEAGRNFTNKLWNATRFVVRCIEPEGTELKIQQTFLPVEDRWILSRLSRAVSSVTSLMEGFQFGEAQRQIHDFLWGEFCDWYIEIAKIRLRSRKGVISPVPVLVYVLEASLRLLHPYMPFVTEELWQHLKKHLSSDWQSIESIMVAPYPKAREVDIDSESELAMNPVIDIIRFIRDRRREFKVESSKRIPVQVQIDAGELRSAISSHAQTIQTLAKVEPITFGDSSVKSPVWGDAMTLGFTLSQGITLSIPFFGMVDLEAERKRLQDEIEKSQAEGARLEARLKDRAFLTKAPAAVIDKQRQRLYTLTDKLERLKQQILKL